MPREADAGRTGNVRAPERTRSRRWRPPRTQGRRRSRKQRSLSQMRVTQRDGVMAEGLRRGARRAARVAGGNSQGDVRETLGVLALLAGARRSRSSPEGHATGPRRSRREASVVLRSRRPPAGASRSAPRARRRRRAAVPRWTRGHPGSTPRKRSSVTRPLSTIFSPLVATHPAIPSLSRCPRPRRTSVGSPTDARRRSSSPSTSMMEVAPAPIRRATSAARPRQDRAGVAGVDQAARRGRQARPGARRARRRAAAPRRDRGRPRPSWPAAGRPRSPRPRRARRRASRGAARRAPPVRSRSRSGRRPRMPPRLPTVRMAPTPRRRRPLRARTRPAEDGVPIGGVDAVREDAWRADPRSQRRQRPLPPGAARLDARDAGASAPSS